MKTLLAVVCIIHACISNCLANSGIESYDLADLGFKNVSIDIKPYDLSRGQVEHIKINPNGRCEYRIEQYPAIGDTPRRPPARQVLNLRKNQLRQLQELLEKTAWLTAEGGEGRASHTHPTTYTITLLQDGREHTIVCRGERPEPYKSLIWFFRGLAHQENLLYQIRYLRNPDRFNACRQIRSDIEALSGKTGRMHPIWDLDYSRYREHFTWVLHNPYSQHKDEIITAIKLFAYLGVESERDNIARLARDHDLHLRDAAAKALGDLNDKESIPLLAELVGPTPEAGWSLIRLGQTAVPTIVQIIERETLPDDIRSEWLVRTYIEHWEELPGPLDPRIIEAARKALNLIRRRARTEYYEAFIELAENETVPSGEVLCRLEFPIVKCLKPLQFIQGWYIVEDGTVVEYGAGPVPDAGTDLFKLVDFEPDVRQDSLHIQTGWQPIRNRYGNNTAPITAEREIEIPRGTTLKVVYTFKQKHRLANDYNPIRIHENNRTLWEAFLLKEGQPIKRIVYVVRVTEPNDPVKVFMPPDSPAPVRGKLPESRPQISFRGVELTEKSFISDPAVIHDISLAWRNDSIKKQGGTPQDVSKTIVVYESSRQDEPVQHVVVFYDSEQNVFYIQVQLKAFQDRRFEYHGPFRGDPQKILGL